MTNRSTHQAMPLQYLTKMWIGLLLGAIIAIGALIVTQTTGQVFGAWNWAEFVLVLCLLQLLILTLLAALDADPDPTLRRWHYVEDPQAEFVLMGAKPGMRLDRRIDPRWISIATPILMLMAVVIVVVVAT